MTLNNVEKDVKHTTPIHDHYNLDIIAKANFDVFSLSFSFDMKKKCTNNIKSTPKLFRIQKDVSKLVKN